MATPVPNHDLDHLFRHEYSKILALLTNKYGNRHLQLIEDAVQEALLKAMKIWPYHEIPKNTSGWLYRVANNYMIDQFRKDQRISGVEIPDMDSGEDFDFPSDDQIQDEQLKMIFACCHPGISISEQIMLSLKLLCGLSVKEISRALMKEEEATKKALTRAKLKFRERVGSLYVPTGWELMARIDPVLKVIYLLFNEGYNATDGEELIRQDICEDSIRLALMLKQNSFTDLPKLNALLTLMCFKSSRFSSRTDNDGNLITFENQDRTSWDSEYINWGNFYFSESAKGEEFSQYHIEAVIESYYVTAEDFASTKWDQILVMYDMLLKINPSPIIELNRVVVIQKLQGPNQALQSLESINDQQTIGKNHLFYAIRAEIHQELNETEKSRKDLLKAIELVKNSKERKFLENKLNQT